MTKMKELSQETWKDLRLTKKEDKRDDISKEDLNQQISMAYMPPEDLVLGVDPIQNNSIYANWRKEHGLKESKYG